MRRPRRSAPLFLGLAALVLVPWIAWLASSLPCRYVSQHWGIAWAGFDAALAVALALPCAAALRRAPWLDRAAVATVTLLAADAWFDVVTSRGAAAVALAAKHARIAWALLAHGTEYRPAGPQTAVALRRPGTADP